MITHTCLHRCNNGQKNRFNFTDTVTLSYHNKTFQDIAQVYHWFYYVRKESLSDILCDTEQTQ